MKTKILKVKIDELSRTQKKNILAFIDGVMLLCSLLLSFAFVDFFAHLSIYYLIFSYCVVMVAYFSMAVRLNIFSILNRYTDYKNLFNLLVAITTAFLALFCIAIFLENYSYRFLILSWIFSILSLIIPRIGWRILNEVLYLKVHGKLDKSVRTLIIGAGAGGNFFVRTVLSGQSDIDIVGIVDGDINKQGTYVHGIKVLGTYRNIPKLVKEYDVDQITIAIPSLSGEKREEILELCNEIKIPVNNMPSSEDLVLGRVSTRELNEINIADLLNRKEVILKQDELDACFSEKTVLVTGAGGSIGSEICRQIARFNPKRLLLLGHGENSIYLIHRELISRYAEQFEIIPLIADIQDRKLIFELMDYYKPDIVYHAAAHKHVPLMEYNPKEAVKNNIFGTKNVAEAAKVSSVKKFVMVSTDKAVNPPNVMGATKRVAEMIVTGLNEAGKTQFVAVRFGNVLGSRGSVVPVFKEQVKKGGPVTVTDFRMTRYFMTIPEASRLVIQASYLANGGEVFVLDMGNPVKILDLAKKVIKLSGHTENEIAIVESGIRPGEKLYEELLSSKERVSQQIHEKIFVGKVTSKPIMEVNDFINTLLSMEEPRLKKELIDFAKQE